MAAGGGTLPLWCLAWCCLLTVPPRVPLLPPLQELLGAGRRDLHAAIARCGGAQKLAEHLGLPYAEMRGRRPRGQQVHGDGALPRAQLVERLRAPPGAGLEADGGGASGPAAAPPGRPRSQRAQGPSSRLLERELVLEAYHDFTLV